MHGYSDIGRKAVWEQDVCPRRLSILVAIPLVAFRLDIDVGLKWFALGFSVFIALFLLLMLGALSAEGQEIVDARDYYGRGTLIGIGIFWLVLIVTITVVLYLKFPRPS